MVEPNRAPPHSDESERALLGAIILDGEELPNISPLVQAHDFYSADHRRIFVACEQLHASGTRVDHTLILEELRRTGDLERVGGEAYLAHLAAIVPSAAGAGEYARVVADMARRRKLLNVGREISKAAYNGADHVLETIERAREIAEASVRDSTLPVVDWDEVPLENIEWFWPGIIPKRMMTMWAARYGGSKTTGVADIVARLVRGDPHPLGGGRFTPGVVLYIHPDEQATDVRRRLFLAGVTDKLLKQWIVAVPWNENMRLDDLGWLRDLLRKYDPTLTIFDTVGDMDLEGALQQPGPGKAATGAMANAFGESNSAALVLSHTVKGKGHGRHEAPYGAASTFGSYKSGFVIRQRAQQPGQDEAEAPLVFGAFLFKPSHARPKPFGYRLEVVEIDGIHGVRVAEWMDDPGFMESEAVDSFSGGGESHKKEKAEDAAADWLLGELSLGPVRVKEVKASAKAAGISERALTDARTALMVDHDQNGLEYWMWLPNDEPGWATKKRRLKTQEEEHP